MRVSCLYPQASGRLEGSRARYERRPPGRAALPVRRTDPVDRASVHRLAENLRMIRMGRRPAMLVPRLRRTGFRRTGTRLLPISARSEKRCHAAINADATFGFELQQRRGRERFRVAADLNMVCGTIALPAPNSVRPLTMSRFICDAGKAMLNDAQEICSIAPRAERYASRSPLSALRRV